LLVCPHSLHCTFRISCVFFFGHDSLVLVVSCNSFFVTINVSGRDSAVLSLMLPFSLHTFSVFSRSFATSIRTTPCVLTCVFGFSWCSGCTRVCLTLEFDNLTPFMVRAYEANQPIGNGWSQGNAKGIVSGAVLLVADPKMRFLKGFKKLLKPEPKDTRAHQPTNVDAKHDRQTEGEHCSGKIVETDKTDHGTD